MVCSFSPLSGTSHRLSLLPLCLSLGLIAHLYLCGQRIGLATNPPAILARFYLTSQPLSLSQSYFISISQSYNHVPSFSIQGHSSPLPSPFLASPPLRYLSICPHLMFLTPPVSPCHHSTPPPCLMLPPLSDCEAPLELFLQTGGDFTEIYMEVADARTNPCVADMPLL